MRANYTDIVTFKFDILYDETMKTGLVAYKTYDLDEEYSYSYSRELDVILLMISYGMAFDNSPFASITMPMNNVLKTLENQKLLKLCMILSCLLPYSFDANKQVSQFLSLHLHKDSLREISNQDVKAFKDFISKYDHMPFTVTQHHLKEAQNTLLTFFRIQTLSKDSAV